MQFANDIYPSFQKYTTWVSHQNNRKRCRRTRSDESCGEGVCFDSVSLKEDYRFLFYFFSIIFRISIFPPKPSVSSTNAPVTFATNTNVKSLVTNTPTTSLFFYVWYYIPAHFLLHILQISYLFSFPLYMSLLLSLCPYHIYIYKAH